MDFIPNEIVLALQIADNIDNIADNGISYKQLTLSGDVLLQCCNRTVIALGELHSVVLPYFKTHKPDIYSIVKKNRDSLLRDMKEVKEIAEQGNKMQWPDKVQNSLRNLAKALRASDNAGEHQNQDRIAVDDKELTILVELAEGTDKTFSQVEIEAATSIKRGTLKEKLQRLESISLIHRPLGERSGYQITDKGREIANRNQ